MTAVSRSRREAQSWPRVLGSWVSGHDRGILGLGGTVLILGLWQAFASSGLVNTSFTSSPVAVVRELYKYLTSANGLLDLRVSGIEFGLGLGLAVALGVPLGIGMGWFPRLEALFDPFVNFFYASPRIALAPLVLIWFGIGLTSKVVVIVLMAMFPIMINTAYGVRAADPQLVLVAKSFNARSMELLRTVVLPNAVPSILSGIRLGLGLGLIGVYVAELTAATAGVGFRMIQSGINFQTSRVLATLFIIAGFGVMCSSLLRRIEKRFGRWRQEFNR